MNKVEDEDKMAGIGTSGEFIEIECTFHEFFNALQELFAKAVGKIRDTLNHEERKQGVAPMVIPGLEPEIGTLGDDFTAAADITKKLAHELKKKEMKGNSPFKFRETRTRFQPDGINYHRFTVKLSRSLFELWKKEEDADIKTIISRLYDVLGEINEPITSKRIFFYYNVQPVIKGWPNKQLIFNLIEMIDDEKRKIKPVR